MPCFTVQTTTIDIGKLQQRHLADALADEGYTVIANTNGYITFSGRGISGQYAQGQLTTQGGDIDAASLKRSYSARLIKYEAKRNGWKLKSQKNGKYLFQKG